MEPTKKLTEIGRCIGCNRPGILDNGVCQDCLNSPNRGRKWAELAHKCRVDPTYAQTIYDSIKTDRGRKLFVLMFGIESVRTSPVSLVSNVVHIH